MTGPYRDARENANKHLKTTIGHSNRIVDRLRCLPESSRIALGVSTGLFILLAVILICVFHAEIWSAILTLLSFVFFAIVLITLLIGAIFLYTTIKKKSRKRLEEAREAQLLGEHRRSEILRAIANGDAKPISDLGPLLVRNAEVVWLRCPARMIGKKDDTTIGQLYVTCLRVVFVGQGSSSETPLGHINAVDFCPNQLQITGKTAGTSQEYFVDDSELVATHIRHAVQVYHRQVDVGFEGEEGRRIPQEVKTAVWQRDGGRCVQCGAEDYLEFDHIIPYSRGGANTVDNVQLLCRRCNLRKTNAI
jgi:hypothetical protein